MNWLDFNNPVLQYEDYSIKDACIRFHDGEWHLFFSAFDQERSSVTQVSTNDFKTFSDFHYLIDGQADGWIGMCSPDITYGNGQYAMVFNSWGGAHELYNRMFYMTSTDLKAWSEYKPLGHELDPDARIIDGALAWDGKQWICCCKWWNKPRMAKAATLDGPWEWISEEPIELLAEGGEDNGLTHENFQMLEVDGEWYLLSTDYKPHHAWLYKMAGDPSKAESWLKWTNGYQLEIPEETFNTRDKDNAAALVNLKDVDGYVYAIYAGQDEVRSDEFTGTAANGKAWARGWNKLAIARSQDMIHWSVPGTE